MPKWSHFLDEDFEDGYEKVERIPHKPKEKPEGVKKAPKPSRIKPHDPNQK